MVQNENTYDPLAFYDNFSILQQPHMLEKSDSQVLPKMLLANQISVFFNCQYLINGLTSDSDFLHVVRHE